MKHVCRSNGHGFCPCAQGPRTISGASIAANVAAITTLRNAAKAKRLAKARITTWRGWTVRLVFRRGTPIIGVGLLDGSDNARNMPEAKAAKAMRLSISRRIRRPLATVGLTRPEASKLTRTLTVKLAPRRKRRG
jgi:hypothetical protein